MRNPFRKKSKVSEAGVRNNGGLGAAVVLGVEHHDDKVVTHYWLTPTKTIELENGHKVHGVQYCASYKYISPWHMDGDAVDVFPANMLGEVFVSDGPLNDYHSFRHGSETLALASMGYRVTTNNDERVIDCEW